MLKYKEILETIIDMLKKSFDESIFLDDESVHGSEGSCFFVSMASALCTPIMLKTNNKDVVMSIKYLPRPQSNNIRMYEVSDELDKLFNRTVNVRNRKLNITKIEQSIKKEESIYTLNFSITLNFLDSIHEEEEVYENMEEINLNLGE
ncbi:phage tail terminator family protein [Clostridioides difficile]